MPVELGAGAFMVPAERRYYAETEEEKFVARIRQTLGRPLPVRGIEDIMLGPDGKTVSGYSYTRIAMGQTCAALAPGLYPLITAIVQPAKPTLTDRKELVRSAVRIFNECLRLRFDECLRDAALVLSPGRRTIEGVVSARYQLYTHLELYELAKKFFADNQFDVVFYEAKIDGQDLLLRFRDSKYLFAIDTPRDKREPFYRCWHFANSEVGRGTLRMTPGLLRRWTSAVSLVAVPGLGDTRHIRGKGFDTKLQSRMDSMLELAKQSSTWASAVEQLRATKLGDGDVAAFMRGLAGRIVKAGHVPLPECREIVQQAVLAGSYKEGVPEPASVHHPYAWIFTSKPLYAEPFKKRTMFDLYNVMAEYGRRKSLRMEERYGQLAHKLLLGTLHI